DAWTQEAFSFPIPGGLVEGRARDGANCFNVNALVNSEGSEGSTGSLANAARFALLIEQLGYTEQEGESIAAAITDWIDPDNSPGFGGAEDPIYATRTRPYRTGGTPIADISELRLIQGVDDERYDVLEEFLCARDDNEFNPLNLNTLEPWQAPLLSSVLGNQVDISAADRLILERPASGYGTVSDALTADVLGTQDLPPDFLDRFSLKSDYYDVEMTVRYRSAVINMTTSLKIRQAGGITTLSRRYGTFE
ncbi:MAG: type II secretion system minor pseudopilin GspK, partial [Pseudomonadota bacterium]